MTKVVISIGYREIVLDLEDAVPVINALAKAERFASKYVPAEGRSPSRTDFHVWSGGDAGTSDTIRIISEHAYRAAKARGNPDD